MATPIAASLGDLTTLALLSWISDSLWADMTEGNDRPPPGLAAPLHLLGHGPGQLRHPLPHCHGGPPGRSLPRTRLHIISSTYYVSKRIQSFRQKPQNFRKRNRKQYQKILCLKKYFFRRSETEINVNQILNCLQTPPNPARNLPMLMSL